MIKWLASNLNPLIQIQGWVINIFKRLDKLEEKAHPPLFEKDQVNKMHKRIEDLETAKFVDKFPRMKNYEGTAEWYL